MDRLSQTTLARARSAAAIPAYDRSRVTAGIVHLGIGAFHRAHQAVYIDDCIAAGGYEWGISGVSLRSPETRDALAPQDGLYTVAVRGTDGERLRVVGSVLGVTVGPEDPQAVLDRLADPAIRIVSLTVTEKAYLRAGSGALDREHADIRADLADPGRPRTLHGYIVEALRRRRDAGVPPFTVLSCDNLPANGETLHALLAEFADLRGDGLCRYVEEEVTCPSTMVDRIVPATTEDDRARVATALGLVDSWPVVTEPFSEWVIEDRFPAGRPALEAAGATLVADVEPFERRKLRLLNGSHSALAYLGLLLGHGTVAEAFADPVLRRFVEGLWREAATTLGPGLDTAAYTARLAERYANPGLVHRTAQIANDGTQKLPQRLLAGAIERLAVGASVDHLATAAAGFALAALARGRQLPSGLFSDPLDARLAMLDPSAEAGVLTRGLFEAAGFAAGAPVRPALEAAVATRLDALRTKGVHAALADLAT